jgi:hypothetical protein
MCSEHPLEIPIGICLWWHAMLGFHASDAGENPPQVLLIFSFTSKFRRDGTSRQSPCDLQRDK